MDYRQRWEHKEYLTGRRLDRRIQLLHGGLILLLLVFFLDFWVLQMVHGEEYSRLAENNRLRKIYLNATRGEILDRYGRVLASTRPSLRLVLVREDSRDLLDQLHRLAPILGVPYEDLARRLNEMRGRPLFEPLVLVEDVKLEELAWIESRREWFPSVEVVQNARRSYPSGNSAAHALGYVGQVNEAELTRLADAGDFRRGDIIGKAGIERGYDLSLRGDRGWKFVSVNTHGRRLGPSRVGRQPAEGNNLQLTLDLALQRVLIDALGNEAGGAVFLDPNNGEILALASAPSYDPNVFADGISHDLWRSIQQDPRRPLHDRVINSFYAPGSTFKVLMSIAGLETETITPSTTVYCGGSATFYKRKRLCWKRGGHGTVDLRKALAQSCNVYFYTLGKQLGIETIHRYGTMFSFGGPTGIDLPGESSGILGNDDWKRRHHREPWYPGDTISVAIGQGLLAVTPMQLATMVSAVANGGSQVTPHLVLGQSREPVPLAVRPETIDLVRQALADAVRIGTGRSARVGGVTVAGKTGTAQVYKHSAGIDADKLPKEERDHAWFVGFAPVEQPRIAFAVVIEHGGHGGTTAAPVARKVMEEFFRNAPRKGDLTAGVVRRPRVDDVRTASSR